MQRLIRFASDFASNFTVAGTSITLLCFGFQFIAAGSPAHAADAGTPAFNACLTLVGKTGQNSEYKPIHSVQCVKEKSRFIGSTSHLVIYTGTDPQDLSNSQKLEIDLSEEDCAAFARGIAKRDKNSKLAPDSDFFKAARPLGRSIKGPWVIRSGCQPGALFGQNCALEAGSSIPNEPCAIDSSRTVQTASTFRQRYEDDVAEADQKTRDAKELKALEQERLRQKDETSKGDNSGLAVFGEQPPEKSPKASQLKKPGLKQVECGDGKKCQGIKIEGFSDLGVSSGE